MSPAPKKYAKVNGVMKLNPKWKKWKEKQEAAAGRGGKVPATTVLDSKQALPVVSSMEDHMELIDNVGKDVPLSDSTNSTIEILQDPDIASETGVNPDEIIDEIGSMMAKYEIPIGLTNKLIMLSEYQSLEFIIDDSGSMRLRTDSVDPATNEPWTRWWEAHHRLKEMIEIIAYVPFEQIGIEFLNRKDRIVLTKQGRSPREFLKDAYEQIDTAFRRSPPSGSTPALEKLQETLIRGEGASIARYFFGDGLPNGGPPAAKEILRIVKCRRDPEQNPITFLSCTDEDEAVEWMKDAEEIAPYCSESDDFNDEAREVYKDQGSALPYTKGFHLICQLVAAMNPDDLDAMDESIPFTKFTLDNLLGVVSNDKTYKHYFDCFLKAQRDRPSNGSPIETIRKNTRWEYEPFRTTNGPAKLIPLVQQVQQQIQQMQPSAFAF